MERQELVKEGQGVIDEENTSCHSITRFSDECLMTLLAESQKG